MLQLEQVVKQYGNHTAVNGISLDVNGGEIYGLLGGNGAGKTTTMRMVLGLIYPDGEAFNMRASHTARSFNERWVICLRNEGCIPR